METSQISPSSVSALIIIGLRSSTHPPFDSTLSVSSVSTSPRLLSLAKIYPPIFPSQRCSRSMGKLGLSEKKFGQRNLFRTRRFHEGRVSKQEIAKAKRRTVSILDILYETRTCGTIPRLNIWTMRVPEYPTMRTLYPRLFCRLRGWEGLRLTIPFVALHMPACTTGVSPRYHKQRPKLNPAFQPPFSFPFYFLEFLLSSLRGEKTNGGRKVEIFFRICVTLAFRFFRPYLGVHGKRTVEGRRLSLLLNLISSSLIRRFLFLLRFI